MSTGTFVNPGSAQVDTAASGHRDVTPAQERIEQRLVDNVVASFGACENPRLREIMVSLTKHLHAFIRDVRLTEEEWGKGIEFLTAAGHITDDVRQEFVLLSDALGASMQTINVNNVAYKGATGQRFSGPSSSRTPPTSNSAAISRSGRPANPAGSRAPSPTPTENHCPARSSRCGRPTRTACTTCSATPRAAPRAVG